MNLREGTHVGLRGEKEGGSGRGERRRRAPRWWEDGRSGGEAGLPVPSAAADFRKGRRGQAAWGWAEGLGPLGIPGEERDPLKVPKHLGVGGGRTTHHVGPRAQAWEGSFPQRLPATPTRPPTAPFAGAAPCGGRGRGGL